MYYFYILSNYGNTWKQVFIFEQKYPGELGIKKVYH